jgi:hypothetical protein
MTKAHVYDTSPVGRRLGCRKLRYLTSHHKLTYLDGAIGRPREERLLGRVHAHGVDGAIVRLELVEDAHLADVNDAELALLAPRDQLITPRRADQRRAVRLLVALERCRVDGACVCRASSRSALYDAYAWPGMGQRITRLPQK